jgi:hypothetical protein
MGFVFSFIFLKESASLVLLARGSFKNIKEKHPTHMKMAM